MTNCYIAAVHNKKKMYMFYIIVIENGDNCTQPDSCEDENAECTGDVCICVEGFFLLSGNNTCLPCVYCIFLLANFEVYKSILTRCKYLCFSVHIHL